MNIRLNFIFQNISWLLNVMSLITKTETLNTKLGDKITLRIN